MSVSAACESDSNSLTGNLQQEISTPRFRVPNAQVVTTLAFRHGMPWVVVLGVLTVGAVIAGLAVDLRWLMVGAMIMLLIVPLAAAWLYFYYGLRPATALNAIPHSVTILPDSMTVKVYPTDKKLPKSPDSLDPKAWRESRQQRTTEADRTREVTFPGDALQEIMIGDRGEFVISLGTDGVLIIPTGCFTDITGAREALCQLLRLSNVK